MHVLYCIVLCSAGAFPHQWCLLVETWSLLALVVAGTLSSNHAGCLGVCRARCQMRGAWPCFVESGREISLTTQREYCLKWILIWESVPNGKCCTVDFSVDQFMCLG